MHFKDCQLSRALRVLLLLQNVNKFVLSKFENASPKN